MTAQLGDIFMQADATETSSDARAEGLADVLFAPDCIAKNLADLFLRAATVTASPTLQLILDGIIQLSNYELRHDGMISR